MTHGTHPVVRRRLDWRERVLHHDLRHVLGDVRELKPSGDISRSPDPSRARLELPVHPHRALLELHAGALGFGLLDMRSAPRRDENFLSNNPLTVRPMHHLEPSFGRDPRRAKSRAHRDPFHGEALANEGADFAIFPGEHFGTELEHGDLGAESSVDLSELEADGPAPEDDEARGQVDLIVGGEVGQEPCFGEAWQGRDRWPRSHREHDAFGRERATVDIHAPPSGEPRGREDHLHSHLPEATGVVVLCDAIARRA